mmetsp:Transcript_8785/g.29336  ORF Transcript_8785/g.29336 Transcript_8785/m.29336 type:complete len:89 (-) Transcript_8785:353-619(-)
MVAGKLMSVAQYRQELRCNHLAHFVVHSALDSSLTPFTKQLAGMSCTPSIVLLMVATLSENVLACVSHPWIVYHPGQRLFPAPTPESK